jgi:predicted ATP-dependent protease
VTEKVEGFFDACQAVHFTGTQGVVIPRANAGELMLREDVVDAIEKKTFTIYAIDSIAEAMEIYMGKNPGELHDETYAKDTILGLAQEKAHRFWEVASPKADAKPT